MNKEQAIEEITQMAEAAELTHADFYTIQKRLNISSPPKAQVVESWFLYLGGALVFASIAVLVSLYWSELNDVSRILLTLGSGLVAYVIGKFFSSTSSRISTVLFLIAGALEPTGMLIAIDLFIHQSPYMESLTLSFVFLVMLAQFLITYKTEALPILLNGTLIFACCAYWSLIHFFHVHLFEIGTNNDYYNVYGIVFGLALFWTTYKLRGAFHTVLLSEGWFFVSACSILANIYDITERSIFEIIYVTSILVILYFSHSLKSILLACLSIGALLFYIGHLSDRYFENSLTWPIALFLLGVGCFWLQSTWKRYARKDGVS